MRLLVTGAAGMLGRDLQSAAARAGHEVIGLTRAELDITDAGAVIAAVRSARPDVVINSAAWTNVDGAESEEEAATAVNGTGAGNVAEAAAAHGAWTVHVSSDYVFDGTASVAYAESSPTGPLSAYGRSKLAGERAVAAAAPRAHTTVRSSWLFGAHGPCFPATIGRLAREREEITVVADQIGCPTFTGHLAAALIEVVETQPLGVLHVAGGGQCSWFQFAEAIVAAAGTHCTVTPGRTEDLGRAAPRPAYSVLETERLGDAPLLPDWEQGLDDYLEEVTKR